MKDLRATPAPRCFHWWYLGPLEIRWRYLDDPQTVPVEEIWA